MPGSGKDMNVQFVEKDFVEVELQLFTRQFTLDKKRIYAKSVVDNLAQIQV